jgi:hypothetical protein
MQLNKPSTDNTLRSIFGQKKVCDIRSIIARHSYVNPPDHSFDYIPLRELDPVKDRDEIARRKAKSALEKKRKIERAKR